MLTTSFKRTLLATFVAALPLPSLADGTLKGRVSDQTGSVYFEGATVSIAGTGYELVTREDGRFHFPSLPAGRYIVEIVYVGADPVKAPVTVKNGQTITLPIKIGDRIELVENIIVVGQAAGALNAINRMRASDNLVSIVTSDSIGQFPDENVTEALQRINGVFIERDQGEGRFVGVRGIDPSLNVASVNGVNIPAPESDRRNVALDVIPSDLVESLEVTKTLTPDQDADAIGGTINIKSLTAFDREGMSYKVQGQAFYSDLEDDNGYKFSGTFTNVFNLSNGELGVAVGVSTNEKNFGTDNIESDGAWAREDGVRYRDDDLEMRNYQITREREGFAMNLDYRSDDGGRYYLRSLYSKFSDQELRNRIEFKLDKGDITFDNNSLTAIRTEMHRELKDRYEEQKINSYLIGGENLVDEWTIEYSLGLSEAGEDEPEHISSQFEYTDVASAGYTSVGATPNIFYSEDGAIAGNFELDEIVVENNFTEDEETAFRFDLTREMSFGDHPGHIKFGGKFRTREKSRDAGVLIFEDFDDALGAAPTLDQFVGGAANYTLGNYGPIIDYGLQRAFVRGNIGGNPACLLATYDEHNCAFILDEDNSLLDSSRDYALEEDVLALYLMSRVDFNDLRITYGLRYEQTDFSAGGFNVLKVDVSGEDDVQVVATSYDNAYTNLLPGINLRYKYADNLILRAAYTQSIARPSFGDLSPTPDEIEIEQDGSDVELKVAAGNPALKPYESQNLDFSLEYYPQSVGVISVGVFYKKIDNFIFDADVSSIVDPTLYAGNIEVTDFEVFQPLNGESADLYGLELGWTRYFTELPAPFDGLLLMANATFTDSEADLGLGADPGRSNHSRLPLQADTVTNFVVGYEKHDWSVRLSSAYIGARVAEIDLEDASNDLYEDTHLQVDLTVKYDITANLQAYFNAVNLNEEPNYRYYGNKRYNAQHDEIGRSFVLGLTYRNF